METKTECKVFFITDFNQQAQYLTEMHRKGWGLTKIRWSFFYHFEKCQPEDVVYQVDFKESKNKDRKSYLRMYEDYGWEFVTSCQSFIIFRKLAKLGGLNYMVIGKVNWNLLKQSSNDAICCLWDYISFYQGRI